MNSTSTPTHTPCSNDELERLNKFSEGKARNNPPLCSRIPDKCGLREQLPDDCVYAIDRRLAAGALKYVLGRLAIFVSSMMKMGMMPLMVRYVASRRRELSKMLLKDLWFTWREPHDDDTCAHLMRKGLKEVGGPRSYNLCMAVERQRMWWDKGSGDGWRANPDLRLADALDLATRKLRPADTRYWPKAGRRKSGEKPCGFPIGDVDHHRYFEDYRCLMWWWLNLKEVTPVTTKTKLVRDNSGEWKVQKPSGPIRLWEEDKAKISHASHRIQNRFRF